MSQAGQGVPFRRSQKIYLQSVDASGHMGFLSYMLRVQTAKRSSLIT
jgi:hypothetical protein